MLIHDCKSLYTGTDVNAFLDNLVISCEPGFDVSIFASEHLPPCGEEGASSQKEMIETLVQELTERGIDFFGATGLFGSYYASSTVAETGLSLHELGDFSSEELCDKIKLEDCRKTYAASQQGSGGVTEENLSVKLDQLRAKYEGSTFINPCTGKEETFEDFEKIACKEGGYSLSSVEYYMDDGGSSLIISDEFKKDCPCVSNLVESLALMGNGNNFISQIVQCVKESEHFRQTFAVGPNALGFKNQVSVGSGNAIMLIPKAVCEGKSSFSDFEVGVRVIHEFLHAHFAELLHNQYQGNIPNDIIIPNPLDSTELVINTNYWLEMVQGYTQSQNPPSAVQHVLYFTHLLNLVAEGLHQISGSGDVNDYLYIAHKIVNSVSIAEKFGSQLGLPADLSYENTAEGQYLDTMFSDWIASGAESNFDFDCE